MLTRFVGVVHVSTQDDVYQNYFIPKETYVLPNTWLVFDFTQKIHF